MRQAIVESVPAKNKLEWEQGMTWRLARFLLASRHRQAYTPTNNSG